MRRSPDTLEALALELRSKLDMDNVEYVDIRAVLAGVQRLYPELIILRVRNEELRDADGMYDPATRSLKLPDRVFEALDKNVPRARFSIMHELAHPLLGHQNIRYRHAQKKPHEIASPYVASDEAEADEFAAFFIAPNHLCDGCSTVEDFIERFGFSRRAATIRKEEHDRFLRHTTGQQRFLPQSGAEYLQEQRRKGYTVTSIIDPLQTQEPATPKNTPPVSSGGEICLHCGNFSTVRNGLQLVCTVCGSRFSL
jgi:Zn-dependent peptidase ImmA (M78 family)